ncbi:LOW QUALITY PROTEIN: pentatricopeptide repeat-containing protein At2g30780 [Amborella trichopoda]|uniref:LOW QUALITY PROTEIN: pentatricopeptide repeat-containing protein At2g30780 n=1 Tax=Amborella trichopoda TaxID=13333 RepID=UPI0009BEC5E5|nr:LOW QUALITY PROTEIN: pentatricopeptide repeat-containing protein At2g30780 [Amborella trichopoda]|eukprot:XP_020518464.1 LOW QUALITY PROTEIN: pentatricopeptide repeat-containing protein At2g30780 [Amborella trichopoda]
MAGRIRVLPLFNLVLSHQSNVNRSFSQGPELDASKSLLLKLLQEPDSRIKTTLDSRNNFTSNGDTLLCESFIRALRSSSPKKAQLVLEWKLEKLLKEDTKDPDQFSKLIFLSGKLHNISFALRTFTLMETQGTTPNTDIFNSLISCCEASGLLTMALSLFEIMSKAGHCKPNLATYNAIISLYSSLADVKNMRTWFLACKKAGFSPNSETYEHLIRASFKARLFEEFDKYYEDILASNLIPNLVTVELIVKGLSGEKNLVRIKSVVNSINRVWPVSSSVIEGLLALYNEFGMVEEIEKLLDLSSLVSESDILLHIYSRIIMHYVAADQLDEVEYSIGKLLKEGKSFTSCGDIEAVISCYFRNREYERLEVFWDRITEVYEIEESTFSLLVAGYRRVGMSEKVEMVMNWRKRASRSVPDVVFISE